MFLYSSISGMEIVIGSFVTPLSINFNSLIANQIIKIDGSQFLNDALMTNEKQEVCQSEVVEHKIDNYEAIKDLSFRIIKKEIC